MVAQIFFFRISVWLLGPTWPRAPRQEAAAGLLDLADTQRYGIVCQVGILRCFSILPAAARADLTTTSSPSEQSLGTPSVLCHWVVDSSAQALLCRAHLTRSLHPLCLP